MNVGNIANIQCCQYQFSFSNGEELVGVGGFSSRLELELEEGIVNFLS